MIAGYSTRGLGYPIQEPTPSQIKAAKSIAEKLGIDMPAAYTKRAYAQYISNHVKGKEERRFKKHED